MSSEQQTDGSSGFDLSRRTLLKTGVSAATVSGLAGCNAIDPLEQQFFEFAAAPVGLAESAEGPDYDRDRNFERTVERHPSVLGNEITVTITNYISLYRGDVDTLGLLASPRAEIPIVNDPQNPLATQSMEDILTGRTGERLLQNAGIVEETDITWERGPRLVETRDDELLGHETEIRSFAGVIEGKGFHLVNAVRVEDAKDVVFAVTVEDRTKGGGQLIGTDGYMSREDVAESVERLSAILPDVKRTGVGLRITESSTISTEGTEPNYLRVQIRNQHDNKTLYSIGLLSEFYDEEGEFLDMQLAQIAYLGPQERFEGYIPTYFEATAGHAVEGYYTTRDVTTTTPQNIEVVGDSLDDDIVAGEVRNIGSEAVSSFTVRVTFYNEDGAVLGTGDRTVVALGANDTEAFDVAFDDPAQSSGVTIGDYSIDIVQYGRSLLRVR